MIHLKDEYTFCAVFQDGRLAEFNIGETEGGKNADGWHPGEWSSVFEGAIAAVNQCGEVFWVPGVDHDYQALANKVCSKICTWDGSAYLCRDLGHKIEYFYPHQF